MSKRLYAGNLSYSTVAETLTSLFSQFGGVVSAEIIADRDTGQSKGFGFVEMEDTADTDQAIAKLSGKEVDGRKIRVNYAEERRSSYRNRGEGYSGRDRYDSQDDRRGGRRGYGSRRGGYSGDRGGEY